MKLLLKRRIRIALWFVNRRFATPPPQKNNFEYCRQLVRRRDFENYLCLLLLSGEPRNIGIVVRAFNVELSQIVDSTSETRTAEMRLEFWKKSIDETFKGRPPSHPVMISLALLLEQKMLSKKHFQKLISIREHHIHQRPFMSIADVEDYGEYSVSPIFNLLLESTGNDSLDALNASSHIGKASSLVALIRGVPYFMTQRKVLLPTELCVKHSVSQEDILRNKNKDGVKEIIFDVASQANINLQHVKTLKHSLKKDMKKLFFPTVHIESFLKHLQHIDFNIYDSKLNRKDWTLPFKLLFNRK